MNIENAWKKFLKTIIENGESHTKDDGDILQEHLINHCFIDNVLNQFGNQNITTEMFLDMIREGVFNIKDYPMKDIALYDYVTSIDDTSIRANKNFETGEDKFTYTYPNRIFNMTDRDSDFMVDQFNLMTSRLSERFGGSSGSNRAVANIYSATRDCDMKDIPCLQILQATIRHDELILHCFFRSNDCYGAFPSNMLFLNYLGLKLVDELKKEYPLLSFKGISYNSSSLHIYKHDLEAAQKVIVD